MAESRIVEYNDTTKMIHWFYNRHEDDKESMSLKELRDSSKKSSDTVRMKTSR